MMKKLLAALCALLMMGAVAAGETLDLSQFEGGEPPEAAQWEDAVFETRGV